jgi:hypothetical protein
MFKWKYNNGGKFWKVTHTDKSQFEMFIFKESELLKNSKILMRWLEDSLAKY